MPKENKDAIRWVANIFAFLGLAVSLPLIPWFWALKERAGFQFVEGVPNKLDPDHRLRLRPWHPRRHFLPADHARPRCSAPSPILSSWTAIQDRVKEYYIWFLVLQTGMLGVFMANDMFLFFVFWEAMLVPMYLLIGIWGGPRKLYAAIKFFLYTLFGSVLMLLGILFLYFHHHTLTGVYTFYLPDLYATAPKIGGHAAIWLFFAFFLGFAIKVPMFPFHTWLPDAHVEAPTAGSVILAGVLLKMGTYGMIRFSLPFFPAVAMTPWVRQLMITLSIIGIIYGALVSLMQKDMKKLVAYSSVSHLGFCTLGIFAVSPLGLSGSVIQQINHGISTGALFLIVGILYERRHTREISEYGGISNVMPVYATITMIMFLSSMGLPLLNGFVGEFTILRGTFMENKAWAAWAVPPGGDSCRGVPAVALSARFLRQGGESQERKAPGSVGKGTGDLHSARRHRLLDRPLSQAVLPDPIDASEQPGGDGAAGLSRTECQQAGVGNAACNYATTGYKLSQDSRRCHPDPGRKPEWRDLLCVRSSYQFAGEAGRSTPRPRDWRTTRLAKARRALHSG